jgi:hypothetical protein
MTAGERQSCMARLYLRQNYLCRRDLNSKEKPYRARWSEMGRRYMRWEVQPLQIELYILLLFRVFEKGAVSVIVYLHYIESFIHVCIIQQFEYSLF